MPTLGLSNQLARRFLWLTLVIIRLAFARPFRPTAPRQDHQWDFTFPQAPRQRWLTRPRHQQTSNLAPTACAKALCRDMERGSFVRSCCHRYTLLTWRPGPSLTPFCFCPVRQSTQSDAKSTENSTITTTTHGPMSSCRILFPGQPAIE